MTPTIHQERHLSMPRTEAWLFAAFIFIAGLTIGGIVTIAYVHGLI